VKTKKCSRCGKVKPLSEFHKHCRNPDGLKYACKECIRAARQTPEAKLIDAANSRKWRAANREKNREFMRSYMREYRRKNKEKCAEIARRYYLKTKKEREAKEA